MTTGGSEGISWLDVAASAKGIEGQMRAIGGQAAKALAEGANSALGSAMAAPGRTAATALATSMAAGLRELLPASLTTAMRTALQTATAASAGAAAASGRTLGTEVTAGFREGLTGLGAAMRTELTSAVSGVGSSIRAEMAQVFTGVGGGAQLGEQLGTDMAAGLRRALLGGGALLGGAAMEGEASAAGRRLGTTAGTAAASGLSGALAGGLRGGEATAAAEAAGKDWAATAAAGLAAGLGSAAAGRSLAKSLESVLGAQARSVSDAVLQASMAVNQALGAGAARVSASGVGGGWQVQGLLPSGEAMRKAGEAAAGEMATGFSSGLNKLLKMFTPEPLREALSEMLKGASTSVLGPRMTEAIAGLSPAMKAGIAGLVILGTDMLVSGIHGAIRVAETEMQAFSKLGKDAAQSLMGGFTSIIEGKMPDVANILSTGVEGIQTAITLPFNVINATIDSTIGKIPIIGGVVSATTGLVGDALGQVFEGIKTYIGVAGQFGEAILEIGNKWQEAARIIAGTTLGIPEMQRYLSIVGELAASGDVVHFEETARAVGTLQQRLSNLDGTLGPTNEQLKELATTLNLGGEILGVTIDVDAFTAVMNDFGIKAEDANTALLEFVNTARLTGENVNTLLHDVEASGPAIDQLGLSWQNAMTFFSQADKLLGHAAESRLPMALGTLAGNLAKTGQDWGAINTQVHTYLDLSEAAAKANDPAKAKQYRDAALEYLEAAGGVKGRAAVTILDLMRKGIDLTPESLNKVGAKLQSQLLTPLEELKNKTETFTDTLARLSNQVAAALAPLGLSLVGKLNDLGTHISDWLRDNQAKFIGWVGKVAETLLDWGVKISSGMADLLRDFAKSAQGFKDSLVDMMTTVAKVMIAIGKPFENQPDWDATPFSRALKAGAQAGREALASLQDLKDWKLGDNMTDAADSLYAVSQRIAGVDRNVTDLVAHSQQVAGIYRAVQADFAAKPGEEEKRQGAIVADPKLGLAIAPEASPEERAKAIAKTKEQLLTQGIGIEVDAATGKILGFSAAAGEADDQIKNLTELLRTSLGPEQFAKLGGTIKIDVDTSLHVEHPPEHHEVPQPGSKDKPPAQAPPGSEPPDPTLFIPIVGTWWSWFKDLFGGAQHGGTVTGPGGVDAVPIWATAGEKIMNLGASTQFGPQLDWMNAQAFQTGGTVLGAAGIPADLQTGTASAGVIGLPAGINLITPPPMTEADALTSAGIPDKYQGQVPVAGVSQTGVALPTALDVKPGERQDVAAVMTSLGIPSSLQGPDGIKIPVTLDLSTTQTQLQVSGATGPGPGGPVQAQVAQAMTGGGFIGMREGGFPDSEWGALSNLIQGESSWDPGARNPSSGAFGLFQFLGHEHDKYGQLGGYSTNPYQQATAGMAYIRDVYGTPTNAYATWLSRSPHWYATGGPVGVAMAGGGFVPGGLATGDYSADDIAGVDAEILGADVIAHQMGLRLTSGKAHHPVDRGYHPKGMAGDFSNGTDTPEETRFATYMASNFKTSIAELIHAGGGWNTDFNIGQGKFISEWKAQGNPYYDQGTLAGHHDHVHLAMVPGSSTALEQLATSGTLPTNWQATGSGLSFAPSVSLMSGVRTGVSTSGHGGLNPVLAGLVQGVFEALGFKLPHPEEFWNLVAGHDQADSGGPPGRMMAGGGHITGYHWPGRDSVPMLVPPGTFILNRHRSAQYRDIADRMLGMATGGMIPIITEPGERVFPPGIAPPGFLNAMNSGRLLRRQPGGPTGDTTVDLHTSGPADVTVHVTPPPVPAPSDVSGASLTPLLQRVAAAPGAPGAVQTPFGWFTLPTPENQWMGLSRQDALAVRRFLDQWQNQQQTATDDAERLHKAEDDAAKASDRLTAAKNRMHDLLTVGGGPAATAAEAILAGESPEAYRVRQKDIVDKAEKELKAAIEDNTHKQEALTNAQKANTHAQQQATDALLEPLPGATDRRTLTPDENAAAMGAGLIKGMAQELGFGTVFAKPPWEWGIWKLFAGTASAALDIANRLGEAKGGAMPPTGVLPLPPAGTGSGDKQAGAAAGAPGAPGGARAPEAGPGGFPPPGSQAAAVYAMRPVAEGNEPTGWRELKDKGVWELLIGPTKRGSGRYFTADGKGVTGTLATTGLPGPEPLPAPPPPLSEQIGPLPPDPNLPPMTRQLPHIPSQPGPGQSGPSAPGGPDWRYQGPTIGPASFSGGDGAQLANYTSATDWVMHPARSALADYQARTGTLPGMAPRPPAGVASWMAASQPPAAVPPAAATGGNIIGTQITMHVTDTPDHVFQGHVQSAVVAGNRAPQLAGGAGTPH